jgi:hypothetical protein
VGPLIRVAAVAAVVAAGAVVAVLALGRSSTGPALDPTAVFSAHAELVPQAVGFGDRVTARITVLVDRGVVDLARIRVTDDLAPLTVLGGPQVRRLVLGRTGVLSIETPAVCLAEQCTAGDGLRLLRLRSTTIQAPKAGGGTIAATVAWPILAVRGRVLAADLRQADPPFRGDSTLPPTALRLAPATLAWVLDALAAALAVAAVALGARGFYLWQARRRTAAAELSELERALALAGQSERRAAPDRRRAVGLLARLLRGRQDDLSRRAGDLAWSKPQPTPEAVSELVRDASSEVQS